MKKSDLRIETFRGKGKGGQHKNKTDSCVRVTHVPTGISVTIDGRNQHANKRAAIKELKVRLKELDEDKRAVHKKKLRDEKIHDNTRVRTYDYSRGIVTDHRTGKTASIKDIVEKGKLDKFK